MKSFIFDTETTGLPKQAGYNKYFSYTDLTKYNSCRIVSICWYIYDDENKVKSFYNIIKPNNFIIDNNSIACKINGITQEIANDKGIDINDMFEQLKEDLYDVDRIIAHNINFDKHILLAELFRHNKQDIIDLFLKKDFYCTMEHGMPIANITFKNSKKIKSPKLIELYKFFYNEEFDGAHNAEVDVIACAKCYFKMIKT